MDEFYRAWLDAPISRRGTGCAKWDGLQSRFGRDDLTAAWVADMDFRTVPEIPKALSERALQGIYGYGLHDEAEKRAEIGWLSRRHGVNVLPEWILYSPGVVDSVYFCVRALTKPGDAILVQTPAYGPFFRVVSQFDCTLCESPLLETPQGWRMDFDDIEAQLRRGVRLMILCNPHNPVGRVWTRDELQTLVDLCNRYGATLISDEIHADFAFDGRKVARLFSLKDADRHIMLTSATKSFNLAGLRQSSCIVRDEALRARILREMQCAHATDPNLFGAIAQRIAYESGDAWMDAVCQYICENRNHVSDAVRDRFPVVRAPRQEGTYLMWLDFRALGLDQPALERFMIQKVGAALNSGTDFGATGRGFMRLNLATQRNHIDTILDHLETALGSERYL